MRSEHRDLQHWIKQRHGHKYRVAAEIDGKNRLPDWERHWYEPDVILRNSSDKIVYIIEVENDPVRKALVGASVLADACIAEIGQQARPRLILVVYTGVGIKQIPNFKEKLQIAKRYCHHLDDIEVYPETVFKEMEL